MKAPRVPRRVVEKLDRLPPVPPRSEPITKDELLDILRARLTLTLSTSEVSDWSSKGYKIVVGLLLDDEVISTAEDTIDVAVRTTSETWNFTHDD